MANIKSQKKRIKTNEKARMRNRIHRNSLRTALKKMDDLIQKEEKKAVEEFLPFVHKKIDSALSKGIIHKNKAQRLKSRYTLAANNLLGHSVTSKKASSKKETKKEETKETQE